MATPKDAPYKKSQRIAALAHRRAYLRDSRGRLRFIGHTATRFGLSSVFANNSGSIELMAQFGRIVDGSRKGKGVAVEVKKNNKRKSTRRIAAKSRRGNRR